jgi:hypothetical protein
MLLNPLPGNHSIEQDVSALPLDVSGTSWAVSKACAMLALPIVMSFDKSNPHALPVLYNSTMKICDAYGLPGGKSDS